MGFATHLGSWLLGTVKNTTGTTAGTIQNLGACPCIQQKTILYTDITAGTLACVLPAGAMIQSVNFNTTVAYATTTPTIALFINGTAINTAANITAFGGTGVASIALGNNNAAGAVLVSNVGSTDALLTFTQANVTATSGAGVLTVAYVVRGSDGSMFPTPQQQ